MPLQHIWVYALTTCSHDGSKHACYIGKTVNLPRRMREHLMVRNGERARGSYELFQWACAENVEVRVTVLSVMAMDWRQSFDLEGYWLKLAQQAGYETPGSDRWGKLPMPLELAGQPGAWPLERVVLGALKLEHVAERNSPPTALYNFSEY
jgi:predicted GIY-YIG superfamily endonuclease